ncbi:MAG: Flp pilus assembly complex ATPase component TadA [Oscillospiraceae bacterium]|nr:Flp pilus assembly complex ATPase component TadA [Oscillospiraceae bacterium]
MKESMEAERYIRACKLLPERLSIAALDISRERMSCVEEIRLRIGREISLTLPEGEIPLPQTRVIAEDLEQVIDRTTEFSRYMAEETIRMGFITAQGGYRIGICGTVVSDGETNQTIRDISSLAIRIPKEREDIARPLLQQLLVDGRVVSTLILSPPGGGKTTFLRDLVRILSDGTELSAPHRISLVDERGEIAAMHHGTAQLAVGSHTDVMDACPKVLAIPMLLRAMSPQVIALDEIAQADDAKALLAAAKCGVGLLATVHAASLAELNRRPILRDILDSGIFERAVVISGRGKNRRYCVEVLP